MPSQLPSPFATSPHPAARCAAEILQSELKAGEHGALGHDFVAPGEGKMLGVLVVRDKHTRLGFIRAGSGMIGGSWRPPGFIPPLFDDEARDRFWPEGQERLEEFAQQVEALESGAVAQSLATRAAAMVQIHRHLEEALRTEHKRSKATRARSRKAGNLSAEELQRLSQQSQDERRAGKRLRAEHKSETAALEVELDEHRQQIRELKGRRADTSNDLLAQIQGGYQIRNAHGESRDLSSLYIGVAPGGSGDCAGPKLLGYAYEHGLEPVAFAEFWWGAEPVGGGRHSGQYYPACRGKCGPLLTFMLEGLAHDTPPLFASETPDKRPPNTIYDDEHVFAVHKPEGLLSVPGASEELRDSVLSRVRAAHQGTDKPLQIHRLDRDTSGVMLLAKTREAHRAMQALFAERQIEKRYVAWLDGEVLPARGHISLPLRVDLEDRPRQIVDEVHGKEAVTDYEVIERHSGLTKVAFYPRTGRSHQLRVHAAHPRGLGAPIIGDRLYGKPAARLFLHAESLSFEHPVEGGKVEISCPPETDFDTRATDTDA